MGTTGWLILFICLFTAGTLFFSVVTIALRTYSRGKLQEAFENLGNPELTEELAQKEERLVWSSSFYRVLLNLFVLLLLFAVFAEFREKQLGLIDYIGSFVAGMIIFSIFSLAIPNAWAKYAGESFLSRSYGFIKFFSNLSVPVLFIFKWYDHLIRRLSGIPKPTESEQQEEKQEEFLTDLEQHRMEGVVDLEEQKMIEGVLKLSDTTAGEIMTPRTDIVAVDVNSDLNSIVRTINQAGHTRVPVFEDEIDNIIGFVYAKDLLLQIDSNAENFDLRKMLREPYFVPETKLLRVLLHEFQTQKLHIAVILDEYGGTAGIVTLEDILEELVGEITDEYESAPPEHIRRVDDNTLEVDARTYIDELNDQYDLDLPEEEDYDTIGGFVFSNLGYIPKTGEHFEYNDLKFTISSAEPRRIRFIRVERKSQR